jgi:hypothetical protein
LNNVKRGEGRRKGGELKDGQEVFDEATGGMDGTQRYAYGVTRKMEGHSSDKDNRTTPKEGKEEGKL